MQLSDFLDAGITTAVGVLGTDTVTRSQVTLWPQPPMHVLFSMHMHAIPAASWVVLLLAARSVVLCPCRLLDYAPPAFTLDTYRLDFNPEISILACLANLQELHCRSTWWLSAKD